MRDCFMIFIWRSYDFVLVISYICSIDVTLMSLCNIFNFCWFIWLLSIVFFSPSFCSCYYGTMKRVYETSNLRLTFPCFRKFWVNPKDFTLKRHLISSALNSYKKVLMKKNFPHIVHRIHIDSIIFLKSADISNFLGLFL